MTITEEKIDSVRMACAALALQRGEPVVFPTETVYGLGADATNADAIARIYTIKGRPACNPLIIHVPDLTAAERIGHFDEKARALARAFWPGPLTLVVPLRKPSRIAALATAGLDTVAIRVPAHPVAQCLLHAVERPVAAPSANPSGKTSPTRADHVHSAFADEISIILDGGPASIGLESTIIRCIDGQTILLRPGILTRSMMEDVLGTAPDMIMENGPPSAPGQLASHYAPRATLRLNASHVKSGEALLAFGPTPVAGEDRALFKLNLSIDGDLSEAAANLFHFLHQIDEQGATTVAIAPVPSRGAGEAINDRLKRAAAPRPDPGSHILDPESFRVPFVR